MQRYLRALLRSRRRRSRAATRRRRCPARLYAVPLPRAKSQALATQWYKGSPKIDIVAHSLGVTIARKFMLDYPALGADVVAFVGIAGANHGTTVCRGMETSYYVCNEIAPGSSWLARLNGPGGSLEAYPPTDWMTVYDGLEGDPFYIGPDERSPRLMGADNRTFPGAYHNDLRVDPREVDTYLSFLLRYGQRGPGVDLKGAAEADAIDRTQPNGLTGPELCGVPTLTGPVSGCSGQSKTTRRRQLIANGRLANSYARNPHS